MSRVIPRTWLETVQEDVRHTGAPVYVGGQGAVPPLPLPLQPVPLLLHPGAVRGPAAAAVKDLLGELVLISAVAASQRGLKWTQYCRHSEQLGNLLLFSFHKSQSAHWLLLHIHQMSLCMSDVHCAMSRGQLSPQSQHSPPPLTALHQTPAPGQSRPGWEIMGKHSQVTSADYHDPELLHHRRTEEQGAWSRFIRVKSTWSQRAIVCNALLLQGTVSDHSRTDVGGWWTGQ